MSFSKCLKRSSILCQSHVPFFYKCKNIELILNCHKDLGEDLTIIDLYDVLHECLKNPLTLCVQRVTSLCFDLMASHSDQPEHHELVTSKSDADGKSTENFRLIDLAKKACERVIEVRKEDQAMSDRFMICLCDFIWQTILPCPKAHENFLRVGGVFSILDVIEKIPNDYRKPWLSMLTDFCDYNACRNDFALSALVQVLAWKGKNAKKGIYEMLARLYKEDEAANGELLTSQINNRRHCVITDKDKDKQPSTGSYMEPLMARCNMSPDDITAIVECGDVDITPAFIAPFMSSIRAKVHAFLKVITAWSDQVLDDIQLKYGVDGGESKLKLHEKITLLSAHNYLWNVRKNLIFISCRDETGNGLNELQEIELRKHDEKQEKLTRDVIEMYRVSRLPKALEALATLRHADRTANRLSLLKEKQKQIDSLKATTWRPDADPAGVFGEDGAVSAIGTHHVTVDTNIAVTALYDQHIKIIRDV